MVRYAPPEPHVEVHHDYVLTEEDRNLIAAFEFRLSNNLWTLRDAVEWLTDFPYAKKLIDNVVNYGRYFDARRQAITDTIPLLAASHNPDIAVLPTPLQKVATTLEKLVIALQAYPATRSAEAAKKLLADCRAICDQVKPLGDTIGNNPAYRAYKKYIDDNKLEAGRVTLDFELEYGEEAA
jgi:hypothetical protein